MIRTPLLTILSLTFASIVSSTSDKENGACPMWLAPSYINNINAVEKKYGLYAGRTYEKGDLLPLAEIAIPLVDFFTDSNRKKTGDVVSFLEGIAWPEEKIGAQFEGEGESPALVPGSGALANYHSTFFNAKFHEAGVLLRERGEEYPKAGEASPMRGAVTPYFNATLEAVRKIPAGMEIFADYEKNYEEFEGEPYQDKIRGYDYQLADQIVDKLIEFYAKHPDMSIDMQEDVMEFMFQKVLVAGAGSDAKTITSLIPENPRKLQKVKDAGGTFMYRFRDMIRSDEWFEKNGFCLDTIRQGVSTIPNAGRGAFADRDIENGTNIAFTPLLHIADKEVLKMLKDNDQGDDEEEKSQILLNYVYGHDESDVVFFPLAPQVNLINHGGVEANAHIEWAREGDVIFNPLNYYQHEPEELAATDEAVLIMKVVADRDIAEGEEITINYGASWESAWSKHELEWREDSEGIPHPLQAEDLTEIYKNKPLETTKTLGENPYPEDVEVACFMDVIDFDDGMQMKNQRFGTDIFKFNGPTQYSETGGETPLYRILEVEERYEAPGFFYNYTMKVDLGDRDFSHVHYIPHSACTFVNYVDASDIHLDGAFRHHIGIPDSMMPMSWRH